MPRTRQRRRDELPSTFLPRVAEAADKAMEDVLKEDRLLRQWGIVPPDRTQ